LDLDPVAIRRSKSRFEQVRLDAATVDLASLLAHDQEFAKFHDGILEL
jgi:hypothetical protein